MKDAKKVFHYMSYLQYPFLAIAIIVYVPFVLSLANGEPDWNQLNYTLTIFGVAISFLSLQDVKRTENYYARKVWEHPTTGKIALIIISLMAFSLITIGLLTLYFDMGYLPENISLGITVLGIGFICLLQMTIELFEYYRKDKNATENDIHDQE